MSFGNRSVLFAVIVFALLLRLAFIDVKSMHTDEPWSCFVSAHGWSDIFFKKAIDIGSPPFYFIALRAWRMLLDTEVWMRFLSVIAGIASLFALYFYSERFFGKKTALVVLLLAGSSWIHVYYSQEIRVYAFSIFFSTISFFSFFSAVTENKRAQWVVFFISSTLSMMFWYVQLFAFAVQAAYLLLFRRNKVNIALFFWVVSVSVLVVLYWLLSTVAFFIDTNPLEGPYEKSFTPPILSIPAMVTGFSSGHPSFPLALFSVPVTLFCVFLFLRGIKSEIERFVAFCFFGGLAVFIPALPTLTAFDIRYFLFVYCFFVIMVAAGIQKIRQERVVFLLLFLLVFANVLQIYLTAELFSASKTTWKAMAVCVKSKIGAGDSIGFLTKFDSLGFDYYFKGTESTAIISDFNMLEQFLEKNSGRNTWVYYADEMKFIDANSAAWKSLEAKSAGMPCESVFFIPAER